METYQWKLKYIKWFSPSEMHDDTKNWITELNFTRDEQYFFEELLQEFILKLTNSHKLSNLRNLIGELEDLKKECNTLLSISLSHKNKLTILLDGIDQFEEEEFYRETHHQLVDAVREFLIKHKQVKKDLFKVIKENLRDRKLLLFKS